MLQLDKISLSNKDKHLNNITVNFMAGKFYAVIGKRESGKDALFSLLAGLDTPSEGIICFKNTDMATLNRDDYRAMAVGMIFPTFNLIANATVMDNIQLTLKISGYPYHETAVYGLLNRVGISADQAHKKVSKLTAQQKQCVSIARAVAHNPDVILADEPTENLDAHESLQVLELLRSLAEEGRVVIVMTHTRTVARYCHELWGMNNGHLTFIKENN
ncbi:ABC transporter ATP-binding protein [Erysipelothrix sp. HDW6C]|uniref:ATP-binding cassette domain-containing protein n=1 Tax=Erysipelothrix sp. HDW6C TaxID=2714930 RepID=UPI00140BC909|nr:ABC transporter ATP-binding protein [Erysipelothrix sp. HDW6C]QIK70588.1 ABC transporter ATP-binding protein [Erysipelothrix sp. HDW6C]